MLTLSIQAIILVLYTGRTQIDYKKGEYIVRKNKNFMQIVDTVKYNSFKEKSHLERMLRKKFEDVKLTFLDNNMIMYEYFVHKKNVMDVY